MTETNIEKYRPRTKFLKEKIEKAAFGSKLEREYVIGLCDAEDLAYKHQVMHKPKNFYGSYSFLYPEQFGMYREEYFAMLQELSPIEYVRVLANEVADPKMYGGWRHGSRTQLPKWLSKKDKDMVLKKGEELKKDEKLEEKDERRIDRENEVAKLERLRGWWLKNGGKAQKITRGN